MFAAAVTGYLTLWISEKRNSRCLLFVKAEETALIIPTSLPVCRCKKSTNQVSEVKEKLNKKHVTSVLAGL